MSGGAALSARTLASQASVKKRSIGEAVPNVPIRLYGISLSVRNGSAMIRLQTQRFGVIERPEETVLTFPGGIFGFELHRDWLLLSDREHGSLYWLQSVEQIDLSLVAVDPREFVSDYTLHVRRSQLDQVWSSSEPLTVLAVVTQYDDRLVMNLRNPIVVNPQNRTGRQVVVSDNRPIRYELSAQPVPLKKIA